MPNHVLNKLKIKNQSTENKSLIIKDVLNAEGLVDFSVIKPMPKEMEGFEPFFHAVQLIEKIHNDYPLLAKYALH